MKCAVPKIRGRRNSVRELNENRDFVRSVFGVSHVNRIVLSSDESFIFDLILKFVRTNFHTRSFRKVFSRINVYYASIGTSRYPGEGNIVVKEVSPVIL